MMHSSNISSAIKPQNKALHQQKLLDKKASDALKKNVTYRALSHDSSKDSIYSKLGSVPKIPPNNTVNSNLVKRDILDHGSLPKKIKLNSPSPPRKSSDDSEDAVSSKTSALNTYVCKYCCRQLQSEQQLQKHVQLHHNKAAHVCYVCNYQTISFSALMNHYVKHSGQNGVTIDKFLEKSQECSKNTDSDLPSGVKLSFICKNCKLSFGSKLKLDAHKCPNSLVEKKYKCTYCGSTSSTVEEYRTCVQSHTESPYVCPHCKAKFAKYKLFDSHVQGCKKNKTALKEMKCENCKTFSCCSLKEFLNHQRKCKNVENFVCKDCNLEFSGKECFEEHLDFCVPEFKEKSPSNKAKILPKTTRKYVRKKPRYVCGSCNAPFFLKAEYLQHGKSCVKVPSYDENESASRACSKCGSLISVGKLAQHAKECSGKPKVEKNCAESKKNVCSGAGNEVKESEAVKLPSSSCQNDGENEYESKPKRKFKKKVSSTSEENHPDGMVQDTKDVKKHDVENDTDLKPKRKFKKKIAHSSGETLDQDKAKSVIQNEVKSEVNENLETESKSCQQSNDPESKSKPKRRRRRNAALKKYFQDSEEEIDALQKYEIEQDCDLNKNTFPGGNSEARRSRRKILSKSSFINEEEDEIPKKSPKSIGLKFSKKPRVTMKPKFRRGKYTNGSNKSFLCSVCDFAFCSKSTLLRHKRMHSGDPWYTCKYCGKFFFRKDVYVRHETNVHKEIEKTMFCCCYCKLCYCDSSSLKKHAMEVHKASAFLPHKPRFMVKAEAEETDAKQESVEVSDENAFKLNDFEPDGNTDKKVVTPEVSLYKCSVCSEAFESASLAGSHMATHSKSEVVDESNASDSVRKTDNPPVGLYPKGPAKTGFSKVPKEKVSKPSTSAVPPSLPESDQVHSPETVPESSENHELLPDEHMIQVDSYKKLECLLCEQKFADESLFEAHKKSDHKLVEWYQCLVCSASGDRQDMVEHMFSHMYKIGTFVVNSSAKSLDALLPCLELDKVSNSTKEKESTAVNNEVDLVSDDELPPLREFGLCSCIENVSESIEMVDFVNEAESSIENIEVVENINGVSPCPSPTGDNISQLETKSVSSHNESAEISDSNLQMKDSDAPVLMEVSEKEASPEIPSLIISKNILQSSQNISAGGVSSSISCARTIESDQAPTEAEGKIKSNDAHLKDICNEDADVSSASDNEEPNDDVSSSSNVILEKEMVESTSDASVSDENSVASSSSGDSVDDGDKSNIKSASTDDEGNRTKEEFFRGNTNSFSSLSSSSDSSSEDDSEDDDSSSSDSSSAEENDSVHASPESSVPKEDSEKSNSITAAPVSLDQKILDASFLTGSQELSVHDELVDNPCTNQKDGTDTSLGSTNLMSKESSFVSGPSGHIPSHSVSKGIILDFEPPFGQKRPVKNPIKVAFSSMSNETESDVSVSQLTDKIPDLSTKATSSNDLTSKINKSVASGCSTVSDQENTLDFQSSSDQNVSETEFMTPAVSTSINITKAETFLCVPQSSLNIVKSPESNVRSLNESAPTVIKSLASTIIPSSNQTIVDLQSCFRHKPFILEKGTASSVINKTHGEFQSPMQAQKQLESGVVSRDPVPKINESLASSSCFNSGNNTNIQSISAKKRIFEPTISKPTVSSTTSNKMGSHLSVFQLTEKMPELFKPNISSKGSVCRMSKPSATVSPKNAPVSQSFFNRKESTDTNFSKPISSSSAINELQSNVVDFEPTEKALESLKAVISPQVDGTKTMPLPLISSSANAEIEKQNFHVLPSHKGSKIEVSPSKDRSHSNVPSHFKVTPPSTDFPAKIQPMKSPEIKVITSHSSQASVLPLNLQKCQSAANQSPGSFSQLRSLLQKPTKMDCEKITLYPSSFTNPSLKQASSSSSQMDSEKITIYPASYTDSSFKQGLSDSSKMDSEKITLYPTSYTESSINVGASHPSKMNTEKITLYPASHLDSSSKQGQSDLSKINSEKITLYPASLMDSSEKQGIPNLSKVNSEKITLYPASYTDSSLKIATPNPTKLDSEKITIYPAAFSESSLKEGTSNLSKVDSEKITIYPQSYTDSSIKQADSVPFVKCMSGIGNADLFNSSFILDDKRNFPVQSQSVLSSNHTKSEGTVSSHPNQIISQSLDLSQPRAAAAESPMAYLPPKPPDKADSFFKPCISQSPILDFSDLIQHSFDNPAPTEENIFSFPETVKMTDLYQSNEQIRTADCTTDPNYTPPAFSTGFSCHSCNAVFPSNNQLASHKCLLPEMAKPGGLTFLNQPKNTFQPPGFAGGQPQLPTHPGHSHSGKHLLPPQTFGSTKALPSDLRLKPSPHQTAHSVSPSSSKCNKCQAVFSDIGELMKHSLSCLKPLFARNPQSGDCMNAPGTMQPATNFASFAFDSALPLTNMTPRSTAAYQNFQNTKDPFNS